MNNQKTYQPITGSPDRSTRQANADTNRNNQPRRGRTSRISVTPADRERLDAVAARLGIPRSCVYNMAFQRFADDMGM